MQSSLSRAPSPAPKSGRYELKAELARGGMGIVYRAYDRLAEREVAYKRLLVPEARTRARFEALFQREFNTLVQLAHPAIVEVYEYGFDEVGPFYTMELLDGKGLMELSPLPYREVCRVLRDTASALALLHARRLIHRDLSPANVRVNKDGSAKLIDFGALIPFGPAPDVVGTPAFMAPEQFEGKKLDQRADLYALGALAYWALTRKIAVRAQSLDDLPLAWLDPIVPPTMHVPEIPKALEELVLSLLSRDPLARPASAAEVMERLTAIADLEAEPEEHRVAASYIAHPPLIGRELPLLHVEQALGGVSERIGASLLIEAGQGQGKSALLAEVTVRAQLRGATVLRADAGADGSSFGLARALVRMASALYPDLLSAAGKRDSFFQQVIEPRRLARVESAWSPVQASERQARTLALMQEMLLRASENNPLVIVVDELHRADSESLALIATLSSECHDRALLLVLASNKDAPSSDALLKIRAGSRPITLEALSVAQTLELTNTLFGGAANSQPAANWLHERSGGNPARMMDLARLLLQRKLIHYTGGSFTLPHDVPAGVADDSAAALLARLSDLSPLAHKCASVLSLQEMPLRLEHLTATLKEELREVVLALEELSARGLVSVSDGRAALLSVPLRGALAEALSPDDRRDLHMRSAREMLGDPNSDGSLRMQAGVHLLKAGAETEAVELLTARGDGDFLSGNTPIPLLETVLDVLRRQGRSDEHCLGVLVPLVRGGFFGDPNAQRRHIDRTLAALSNVCGVTTMRRLAPRFGHKLAFIFGLVGALIRHARTPKNMRYGTFPETVAALLSILSASTASCACAFESEKAFEIVTMFEPLRWFGPDSAPYWSMEFCLATAEVGAGHYGVARVIYERLLERFNRPVKGMNDEIHLQFKQGILHGLAQCKVTNTDATCLKLAEELETAHVFFAPHAQSVRMGYHGYRGEAEACDHHRKLGEMLALRGGISWSSTTIMTMRSAYMALGNNDAVGVVRGISELDRLTSVAPKSALYRELLQAGLELLRGRAQRAVDIYERVFADPAAVHMIAHYFDLTMYAKALSATGRHADARRVCEKVLAGFGPHDALYVRKFPIQQLALIDAAEGKVESGARIMDEIIEQLKPFDNPLWSGLAHRDRAKVALVAGDTAAFEKHARIMSELFHGTKNPALIQQCDQLQAAAKAQARGARSSRALDETALAFETSQSHLMTMDDMDRFETEALPSSPPPANDQVG